MAHKPPIPLLQPHQPPCSLNMPGMALLQDFAFAGPSAYNIPPKDICMNGYTILLPSAYSNLPFLFPVLPFALLKNCSIIPISPSLIIFSSLALVIL